MLLLHGIRSVFSRRKPAVEIDLKGTQAGGLADNGLDLDDASIVATATGGAATATTSRGGSRRGSDEVLDVVRKIGDHIERQSQHTERLNGLIDRLPEAIDALPEINRQNARLLDVITDHLERMRVRDESLQATLDRMSDVANHQTEVMGMVQQEMDTHRQLASQLTQTLGTVQTTLGDLSRSTGDSISLLTQMLRASETRSTETAKQFGITQRWMVAGVVCCGIAAAAAVVVTAVVLVG